MSDYSLYLVKRPGICGDIKVYIVAKSWEDLLAHLEDPTEVINIECIAQNVLVHL